MNTFYFKIHVILSGIVQAGMASRQAKGKLRGRGHRGLQKGQEKFAMRYSNYFHLFLLSHLGLSAKRT